MVKKMRNYSNSSSDDVTNKDFGSKAGCIPLELQEDLKENIVSEITYQPRIKTLKIVFSEKDNDKIIYVWPDTKNWQKSLEKMEKKIKENITTLNGSHYLLLENAIYDNLDLILDANNAQPDVQEEEVGNNQGKGKDICLNKYLFGGKLCEWIIVNKSSKFIVVDTSSLLCVANEHNKQSIDAPKYKLLDKLELANSTFYPHDSSLTINPIPYSFESEQELDQYFELAGGETFDSLFSKILTEFKKYVSIDEYVQIILAADIFGSYFQEKFGTTHYNIFVGDNGSGKNSALLVFKHLGYRVFYVTAANAANYYTFLGDIQEGQGTIAEDEADDIGQDKDKQRILKTGYSRGGSVPKIEFSSNGARTQKPFLTFCHKWLAMEELPDERRIKGVLDRSFIFKFLAGDVRYNIKDVVNDPDSEGYKQLFHLRKLLFVFRFLHFGDKFSEVKINVKNRNAELIKPLLGLFYNTKALEKIRKALSILIKEKSTLKNNSLESKLHEALSNLMTDEDKEIYELTNGQIYEEIKKVMDGKDNQWDSASSFFTPDGTSISKKKITQLLKSKFNATSGKIRVEDETKRVVRVSKRWIEKIGKQYEIIEDIQFVAEQESDGNCGCDTMTDVTLVEGATPSFDKKRK